MACPSMPWEGMMSELQATLEFQVELSKFYNLDLFQRGNYQVRVCMKCPPKSPVKLETTLDRRAPSDADQVASPFIEDNVAVSKTFQILYKNEDVTINDVFMFRLHLLVDSNKIEESIERADLQMSVELWFTENDYGSENLEEIECVSQKTLKLHFSPSKGIHQQVPVIFDYFHLCVMSTTIHGTLVALHQPYISLPKMAKSGWNKNQEPSTLESVLFGSRTGLNAPRQSMTGKLRQACRVHKDICRVLLSAYESLQSAFQHIVQRLPTHQQIALEPSDCHKRLESIVEVIQTFDDDEDLLQTANSNVAQLCAENLILWSQYLEMVCLNDYAMQVFTTEHHTQRVKRFSEAYFTQEHTKQHMLSAFEPSVHGHVDFYTMVRTSPYFINLPPLVVECAEMDGDCETLPVIFEDIYTEHLHAMSMSDLYVHVTEDDDSGCPRSEPETEAARAAKPKNKLKFIKNIRPESLKRPSQSLRTTLATDSTKKAELIGFKKIDRDDDLPVYELGTLDPHKDDRPKSAISMPSLFSGHLNREYSGSMPDLSIHRASYSPSIMRLRNLKTRSLCEGDLASRTGSIASRQVRPFSIAEGSVEDTTREEVCSDVMINGVEMSPEGGSDNDDVTLPAITLAESPEELKVEEKTDDVDATSTEVDSGVASRSTDSARSSDSKTEMELAKIRLQQQHWPGRRRASDTYSDGSEKCTVMDLLKEEYRKSQQHRSSLQYDDESDQIRLREGGSRLERPGSLVVSSSSPELNELSQKRLVSQIHDRTVNFITLKEELKRQLKYPGHMYSDFPSVASSVPYFLPLGPGKYDDDMHLVVCVHGLDGNCADLRLVRTYLELALPNSKIDFLMSERNQPDTFADFEVMTQRLVDEILYHIDMYSLNPVKISFIGHSLGNLIIRSALSHPDLTHLRSKMHTLLSLSGPHLGTLYNQSGLVNMGMWFMQKWKKSGSLLQLSLKDHTDVRQTFIYKLSQKPCFEYFKNVLVVASSQDRYVPYHSARIEICKTALKDASSMGSAYIEMVNNILQPTLGNGDTTFVRYDVFHALPNTANSLIGRAAHIAVLDSEIFLEKFITVSALKYFK